MGRMARSTNLVDLALLMQVSCLARNWSFLRHTLYLRAIVPTTFVPTTFVPHMRAFVLSVLTVSGVLLESCRCSPATAVPITMKVVNSTKEPIYVDAVEGKLGLTVQRHVLGQLYPFDDLVCECRYCANACGACAVDCPDGGAMVRRIAPGDVARREWDGVVQVSGLSQCREGGACLNQENAPLNEPFVLKLCFMAQKPTGVTSFDDGGLAPGQIEVAAQTCVEKTFMIEDGVVEIGPERGASCVTTTDCKGTDELCFAGSCTTGCPANAYPAPGSSNLVLSMGNLSSFSRSTTARATTYSGVGTISAIEYQGTTLQVHLSGLPNELRSALLSVLLPPGAGVRLPVGASVSVTYFDNGQKGALANRAIVLRDAASKQLLLAADMAQGAPMLTDAELAPFSVSSGAVPLGCRTSTCGRYLYATRRLASGSDVIDVEPGDRGSLVLSDGTWTILSINDGAFAHGACDVSDMRPWVLWQAL